MTKQAIQLNTQIQKKKKRLLTGDSQTLAELLPCRKQRDPEVQERPFEYLPGRRASGCPRGDAQRDKQQVPARSQEQEQAVDGLQRHSGTTTGRH